MLIIRNHSQLPSQWKGCVATIGNFDGVHCGHQALFLRLQELKKQTQLPIVAMLFEPHPREFFTPNTAPPRLSALRDKMNLLRSLGVDVVFCQRFNKQFSHISAEDFVKNILALQLRVAHLLVGSDFQFGHDRKGNIALLEKMSSDYHYQVECGSEIELQGRRVSSTWIRETLANNDLLTTRRLLGRPYQIEGHVLRGQQRGREWGFPTINLAWPFKQHSLHGVYAVHVRGLKPQLVLGAASVGNRPTVSGENWNIEVHLFDFAEECYGKRVTVQFLQWFREESYFDSIDKLKAQIANDVLMIKSYFNNTQTIPKGE